MNTTTPTKTLAHSMLLCLLLLAALALVAQQSADPLQLQKDGIAKVDHWLDYVRRTGDARSTASELAMAQAELKASFDMFAQRQDYSDAALSALKIAHIQRLQNQFRQAATIYQGAIQLAQHANRTDYQTTALSNLAYSELQLGEIDAAEQHAREAVSLGANCGNKDFYFEALNTAAEIEAKRGNLAAANDDLNRALAMSAQVDKKKVYIAYMDRGDIYEQVARKCDNDRTFDVCLQSVELARADYQKGLAITQELGYTYFSQMFRGFLKNLDVRKAMIQSKQQGDVTVTNAELFSPQKPKDVLVTEYFTSGVMDPATMAFVGKAVKELRDWQARMQQQGLTVLDLNPADLCIEGQYEEMKGNTDAALKAYLQADDLLEKDRRKLGDEQARGAFMEDKLSCYYRPALILLQAKRYPEAFAIFERSRSRAMADLLASRPLTLGSDQERALYSQLQSLKTNIGAQQAKVFDLTGSQNRDQNAKQIVELQGKIAGLQQQYDQLEARIAKEAPKLNELTAVQPVTLASVQRAAAEGNYDVLYYVVMEHALILWHITGDAVQVKDVFLPHVELIKKGSALRTSLVARRDTPDARFDEDTSRQLFLFLIQPMLGSLKGRHLVLVPHEELNSIPFQALQDPATGKYVGETFAISYAPSATVLASLSRQSTLKNGRLLAVADPNIHEAGDEVNAIGKLYPGRSKVVSQDAASTADVKSWVGDYNVVHLSVHGKFNSADPLLSYLQFKDTPPDGGRLTAAEMFGLPLQKNTLVVLSACETGRVEATHSNEVLGMVRSLLYAGADRLVLSSWEVNAGSTRLWMETFYQQGQNNSPAEAARLALVAVKSHPEYSHPFFWAPFVMTGK
jgi:CHAT domain-containing protein